MNLNHTKFFFSTLFLSVALLTACGGGGGAAATAPTSFSIGGTVTGLTGSVVLQDNLGDNLTVAANGAFTFATTVANGSPYSVTALTQPAGQTCAVSAGAGTVSGNNVSNVTVVCTTATAASIYDIKSGLISVGSTVALNQGQLVTGRTSAGYYLQVKEGDFNYIGADFSGIYVADPTNNVTVGNRVTIASATVTNTLGQFMLTSPASPVVSSALVEAAPAPVVVLPAEVATGGIRAAALESVIVQVNNVTVSDINPAVNGGDVTPINEFVVGGSLRVNDALYLIASFPSLSQTFTSLTGILDLRNADSKLELRNAADVVP